MLKAAQGLLAEQRASGDPARLVALADAFPVLGDKYLLDTDRLALVYDQETKQCVADLLRLERLMTALSLLALALVELFIFRPKPPRMHRGLEELEAAARAFA
ncbi:hypothetical protein DFAR_3170012 [Desulfarculales bacterium]